MKSIPEKYHENLQKIISAVRLALSEGKELSTVVFLGRHDEEKMLPFPVRKISNNKKAAMTILRKIVKALQPDFIITAGAAYAFESENISEEEIKKIEKNGVENHPDRKEIFLIMLETPTNFWFGTSEIKILENNKSIFDDFEFKQRGRTESEFIFFSSDGETKH